MNDFKEVWLVDFEFSAQPGEHPEPICMVALELGSGCKLRLWQGELQQLSEAPYSIDKGSLFVAYYASAEVGCHLALGWPVPENVLDLYTEFRNHTNGKLLPSGSGLLGALLYFGVDWMDAADKERMRGLAMRGGPWTPAEQEALLDYCESDVLALSELINKMDPMLDIPRALFRGRYMKAAARIEHVGIPIDTDTLSTLRESWEEIQDELISRIDADYHVYEGRTFKASRWAEYLAANNIAWPQLASGALALDDETFSQMAKLHPQVAPIRDLRYALSQMRLADLEVGSDGRNRTMLSAFRARTGRNQPSNSRFIFGPAVWLRGLIRPKPGFGLAYIDWSQQEFGIAAALSEDKAMMEAYESGDPYLAFAKQAGAVPPEGTKQTHSAIRDQFKACVLAVQYGMGPESLARRINQPVSRARELLQIHRQTYRQFWRWAEAAVDHAMLHGRLWTVFGWTIHVGEEVNPRSLQNFPMQANGAEMLRLACCLATEQGVRVCAPVHDAILIEAPLDELESAVAKTQQLMSDANAIVLNGFRLRSDAKLIHYPDRYMDERGVKMWETVTEIVEDLSPLAKCA